MAYNVVAIVLAGGKGTRLKELTLTRPKPAISFAGKYRLIDYVLSNCTNSGISRVGVLTQYEPLELISYIGEGSSWDLDVYGSSVTVMGPYTSRDYGFLWQGGTAEAVILNMSFIEQYNPDYLLVLSADHIYKMDYQKLIQFHVENEADLTISTIEVDKEDTNRFGIIVEDENHRVVEFQEKPDETDSTLASMGVYVFSWERFKRDIVHKYYKRIYEGVDFAKDVIPQFINDDKKVCAYNYKGYWRDVGTVESYWKAHMDLLDVNNEIRLADKHWPIFSKTVTLPAHHVFPDGIVKNSWVNEGTMILGQVYSSIVAQSCYIGRRAKIKSTVILNNVYIDHDCVVEYAIIGDDVILPPYTYLKGDEDDILLVTKENLDEVLATLNGVGEYE